MSPQRLAIVQAAVAQMGQPYVWGGDWPGPHSAWGAQAHGGFDCSGLVWWAFKGAAGTSQMALGTDIVGRTADQMAFERPGEREPVAAAAPGDLIFFGPEGPKSPQRHHRARGHRARQRLDDPVVRLARAASRSASSRTTGRRRPPSPVARRRSDPRGGAPRRSCARL